MSSSNAKTPGFLSRLVKGSGSSKPDDEAKQAHTRRREQVRRAQRTHRERKEKYVRCLEVEVAELREREARQAQEIEAHKQLIRNLHGLLASNGIPIPKHLQLSPTPSPQASIAFVDYPDGTQGVQATMPSFKDFRQEVQQQEISSPENILSATDTTTTTSTPTHYAETNPSDQMNTINPQQPHHHQQQHTTNPTSQIPNISPSQIPSYLHQTVPTSVAHPAGLDAAQIAVDFVLALERPCLYHHPSDPYNTTTEANGHCLMLQSPIMSRRPDPTLSQPPQSTQYGSSTSTSWSVPAVEIEKLLNLSARLSLEGELTPIEAWQKVKKHPMFQSMSIEQLETLKNIVLEEVKCYGFGAVIDEDYFDYLLQQAFSEVATMH